MLFPTYISVVVSLNWNMEKNEREGGLMAGSLLDSCAETYAAKISIKTRVVYWVILGFVLVGFSSLAFVSVDLSIQSGGVLQSKVARQKVSSSFSGVVLRSNLQNETQIARGDTLLMVSAEAQEARKRALSYRIEELTPRNEDLKRLLNLDSVTVSEINLRLGSEMYSSEYRLFYNQYVQQHRHMEQAEREYLRNLALYKQKAIADVEYEEQRQKYLDEQEDLRLVLQKQLRKWNEDLSTFLQEIKQLNAELSTVNREIATSTVTAPIAGIIQNSTDIQQGGMVMANQLLCEITPDSLLIAIVYVKPADIGFLKVGQQARVQVDAFNYNQWGMLDAMVNEISSDVYTDNANNLFFKVNLTLSRDFMSLKNGYSAKLRKGMTVNARILLTRRTLLNLLYDKADSWFNPYLTSNK